MTLQWPAFGTFHYIQAIKAAIMTRFTRFSDISASTDISPFPVSEIIAPCQAQQYSCGMWTIQPLEPTGGPVLTA